MHSDKWTVGEDLQRWGSSVYDIQMCSHVFTVTVTHKEWQLSERHTCVSKCLCMPGESVLYCECGLFECQICSRSLCSEQWSVMWSDANSLSLPLQRTKGPLKDVRGGIGRTLVHSEGYPALRRHNRMSRLQLWTKSGLWTKVYIPWPGKKNKKTSYVLTRRHSLRTKCSCHCAASTRTFPRETGRAGLQELVGGRQRVKDCSLCGGFLLLFYHSERKNSGNASRTDKKAAGKTRQTISLTL